LPDVGKVLGLPESLLASVRDQFLEPVIGPTDMTDQLGLLRNLCHQLHGFPRHIGIHNGGMVITAAPLAERLPTEPATMPGRVVVQWDKDALETAGLVKIDLLGLRMLAAIAEAERLITALTGQSPRLDRLTFADPAVYEMIARADTLGVFQVESRAQAQILPRLKPGCFADLIITISLIRPGPIQGNMVHPYLRRRLGQEPVIYLHPRLEPALAETLGVILFQEQVLKVARDLAGFTPGQGELLRRALGSKYSELEIGRLKEAFIAGALHNGVPLAIAETVFAQLQAFGGYSFAKSHAAAFAVLVYQSAWLKRYYPAPFLCALLNHQPLGFWSPAVLVGDARRRGLTVLPVDLQRSQAKCSLEGEAIRLGFNYVAGLGENGGARLVTARQTGPFRDLADLCRRTRLPRRLVEQLILAGALDGWGAPRRQLLWALGQLTYQAEELPLDYPAEAIDLPSLSAFETLAWERQVLGLPNGTGEHVLTSYRPWLVEQGILGSQDLARLPEGAAVRVAGLVVVHQSPLTAKGFHFLTLEDEAGLLDVIIRPAIYNRYRRLIRHEPLLIVAGQVQRQQGVVNILARQVMALPDTRRFCGK
jgi:error-prone DNA polymerase